MKRCNRTYPRDYRDGFFVSSAVHAHRCIRFIIFLFADIANVIHFKDFQTSNPLRNIRTQNSPVSECCSFGYPKCLIRIRRLEHYKNQKIFNIRIKTFSSVFRMDSRWCLLSTNTTFFSFIRHNIKLLRLLNLYSQTIASKMKKPIVTTNVWSVIDRSDRYRR